MGPRADSPLLGAVDSANTFPFKEVSLALICSAMSQLRCFAVKSGK